MEIYTGIDIIENIRIKKAIEKHGKNFLNRIFLKSELEYCLTKEKSIECLSARFALKEAFIKAFYTYCGKTLSFRSIEIPGQTGKPAEILLHLQTKELEEAANRIKYTFSISHERNYSVATVIIYLP